MLPARPRIACGQKSDCGGGTLSCLTFGEGDVEKLPAAAQDLQKGHDQAKVKSLLSLPPGKALNTSVAVWSVPMPGT